MREVIGRLGEAVSGYSAVKDVGDYLQGFQKQKKFVTSGEHYQGKDLRTPEKPIEHFVDVHIDSSDLRYAYVTAPAPKAKDKYQKPIAVHLGNPVFEKSDLSHFSFGDFTDMQQSQMIVGKTTRFGDANLDSANLLLLVVDTSEGPKNGDGLREFFRKQNTKQLDGQPSSDKALYTVEDVYNKLEKGLDDYNFDNKEQQVYLKHLITSGLKFSYAARNPKNQAAFDAIATKTIAPDRDEQDSFTRLARQVIEKYPFVLGHTTEREDALVAKALFNNQQEFSGAKKKGLETATHKPMEMKPVSQSNSASSSPAAEPAKPRKEEELGALDLGASASATPPVGRSNASASSATVQPASREELRTPTPPLPQEDAPAEGRSSPRASSSARPATPDEIKSDETVVPISKGKSFVAAEETRQQNKSSKKGKGNGKG